MKVEPRFVSGKSMLIPTVESEEESMLIDDCLGNRIPFNIKGIVNLSDDYGEHYILLEKDTNPQPEVKTSVQVHYLPLFDNT